MKREINLPKYEEKLECSNSEVISFNNRNNNAVEQDEKNEQENEIFEDEDLQRVKIKLNQRNRNYAM